MDQCHRDYAAFELFQATVKNRAEVYEAVEKFEALGWVRLSSYTTGGIEFIRLGWPVHLGRPVRPV